MSIENVPESRSARLLREITGGSAAITILAVLISLAVGACGRSRYSALARIW